MIKIRLTRSLLLLSSLYIMSVWGCDDPPPPTSSPSMDTGEPIAQDLALSDLGVDQDLALPDLEPLESDLEPPPPPALPAPGWIELNLTPGRTYYELSSTPTLTVLGFDIYGDPLNDSSYHYRFDQALIELSDQAGEVIAPSVPTRARDLSLRFIGEGETEIEVCAIDEQNPNVPSAVCARRPLIIDNSAPQIVIFWPPRGAMIAASDPWPTWESVAPEIEPPAELFEGQFETIPETLAEGLPIYGQVLEGRGELNVALNDSPLDVDAEGRFSAVISPRPSYLEIKVSADDGVRSTLSLNQRWVLYAHEYLTSEADRSVIERGLAVALNQELIDRDAPPSEIDPLELTEAAQFVQLLFAALDPALLLGNGTLINTPELALTLSEIDLGEPEIDLMITEEGLSLFAGLSEATVTVTGQLEIGSAQVDLSGSLEVGMGAFADYRLERGVNVPFEISYLSGGVTLTQLTPRLNNPAANALLEVLESTARSLVVDQLEAELLATLQEEIPQVLEVAITDLFSSLSQLEINLNAFEESPELRLRFNIDPSELLFRPDQIAQVLADWSVTRINPPEEQLITELRGVPGLYPQGPPPMLNGGLSLQIHLNLINSIFAEVTRGGLLSLSPPVPASAQFFYSSITVQASSPPIVTRGDSSEPYPLYMELGGISLKLTQSATEIEDEYELFVRVGAQIEVNAGIFSVALAPAPEVIVSLVQLNNERALVSEQLIANLVLDQVWPALSGAISDQLSLGFPDTPLPLAELSQAGVNLDAEATLQVRFSELVDYHTSGWIGLVGGLSILFE